MCGLFRFFTSFRITGLGGLFVVALFDAVEEAVFAPGADVALGGGLGDAEPAGELEEGLGGEVAGRDERNCCWRSERSAAGLPRSALESSR